MNLGDLIKAQKSTRTFVQLEADCGGQPSAQRLQQLASRPPRNFPDPATIRAIARGLRVTEVAVVLASAESLGLDVSRAAPKVLDYLPASVNELADDQLHAIGNLVRSFTRGLDDTHAAVTRLPTPSADVAGVAARETDVVGGRIVSRGRRARQRQDDDAVGPDAEGPQDGA